MLHLKLYARRALYLNLSASLDCMQVDSDNRHLFESYIVLIFSKKCPLSKQTIENGLPPIAGSHFPPYELGPRRREKKLTSSLQSLCNIPCLPGCSHYSTHSFVVVITILTIGLSLSLAFSLKNSPPLLPQQQSWTEFHSHIHERLPVTTTHSRVPTYYNTLNVFLCFCFLFFCLCFSRLFVASLTISPTTYIKK